MAGRVVRVVEVALVLCILLLASSGCSRGTGPTAEQEATRSSSQALSGDGGGDAGPPSPSIGTFAVYATEALEMSGTSLITGCNVGVENTTGPFLAGNAAAYFNSGSTIQSTQTLYA
jgi:hypothetical protein